MVKLNLRIVRGVGVGWGGVLYLKEELDVLNAAATTGQVNRTVINKIPGKNKANRDGTQLKNTKDLLSEWQAYFKGLLKEHVALDRTSWTIKSVCNCFL